MQLGPQKLSGDSRNLIELINIFCKIIEHKIKMYHSIYPTYQQRVTIKYDFKRNFTHNTIKNIKGLEINFPSEHL